MSIEVFDHLADAVVPYDGVILDVWGCLHDGGAIFADAAQALAGLQEAAIPVVLLSNAPRRSDRVAEILAEKGLAPGLVRTILTSGDAARAALAARAAPWAGAPIIWDRRAATACSTGSITPKATTSRAATSSCAPGSTGPRKALPTTIPSWPQAPSTACP